MSPLVAGAPPSQKSVHVQLRRAQTNELCSENISVAIFVPISEFQISRYWRRPLLTYPFTLSAFVAWDYLLTFDREVRCFWSGKFTPACVLFFVTRYCSLVFNFLLMASLLVHGVSVSNANPSVTRRGLIDQARSASKGTDALSSSNCKFVRAIAGVSYFPFIPWAG